MHLGNPRHACQTRICPLFVVVYRDFLENTCLLFSYFLLFSLCFFIHGKFLIIFSLPPPPTHPPSIVFAPFEISHSGCWLFCLGNLETIHPISLSLSACLSVSLSLSIIKIKTWMDGCSVVSSVRPSFSSSITSCCLLFLFFKPLPAVVAPEEIWERAIKSKQNLDLNKFTIDNLD